MRQPAHLLPPTRSLSKVIRVAGCRDQARSNAYLTGTGKGYVVFLTTPPLHRATAQPLEPPLDIKPNDM